MSLKLFKTSAFDLYRKEEENPRLISMIKDLDTHLSGGIMLGTITELCGMPGAGKTQLCLQYSINIQLPKESGGNGAKAFYVDTNQGFSVYRLKEIAEHMEMHLQHSLEASYQFNATNILQNISYVYCSNYLHLIATLLNLRNILSDDKNLKLIIVDSFSFLLRQLEDVTLRTRMAYEILTDLHILATEYNVAIIITNELTTRCINSNWFVAPALGDSHAHKINTRLILSRDPNHEQYHIVRVDKSANCDKAFRFKIRSGGVRGCTKPLM